MKYFLPLHIVGLTFLLNITSAVAQLTQAYAQDYSLDSLSAQSHYEYVQLLNSYGKSVSQRNRKTHRLDSVYRYSTKNATQPLDIVGRSLFEYSDTVLIEKQSVLLYDLASHIDGRWQGSNYYKYKLDPTTGQLKERTRQQLPSDEFVQDSFPVTIRHIYSYNSENLLDTIWEGNDYAISVDTISAIYSYKYDSLNRLDKIRKFGRFSAMETTMLLKEENSYNYNDNGQVDYYVENTYIPSGPTSKDSTHYHYDDQGYLIKEEYFTYYMNWPTYLYEYDNYLSGQPESVYVHSWFARDTALYYYSEESWKLQNTGDPGNMTATVWRGGQFLGTVYGSTLENDRNIPNEQVIYPFPYAYNSKYNNMILYESSFNDHFFTFIVDHTVRPYGIRYFYTNLDDSSTSDLAAGDLQVKAFPNPAMEVLSFVSTDLVHQQDFHLKIYNTAGQLASSAQHNWNENYSITELEAGIYFYQIEQDGMIGSGRFVKL